MNGERTLQGLLEVQAYFGLPNPALVEKDFHVVRALAAIASVETEPFSVRLVFGGGTALSRAPRLVRGMSEDIDLKIVGGNNRSARGALRRLRARITDALLAAGFKFDPADPAYRKSGNESCYTIYRLPYEPVTTGALRPTIQIETGVAAAPAGGRAAGDLVRSGSAAAAGGHKLSLRLNRRDGGG